MKKNKVVICASIALTQAINDWNKKFKKQNFQVLKYPEDINGNFEKGYVKEFSQHYQSIQKTNILFVLNKMKNKTPGYIGPSVFAEIAFAIGLNKSLNKKIKIYCLNAIPKSLPYSQELSLWKRLGWIELWKDSPYNHQFKK